MTSKPAPKATLDLKICSLDSVFNPSSIAVIGAKEALHSVGRTLFLNLTESGFAGHVFAVNPNHTILFGRPCYASVENIPEKVDLAIIAVPAAHVPGVIEQCVKKHVGGVIVISSGFKESGDAGRVLEEKIVAIAKKSCMRLLGPNCLGILVPRLGLNGSFAKNMPKNGSVAFISQSGALCSAVLDWSRQENVGFSSFVSVGSMADIDWGDLIKYFGEDPNTKSILMYMETVGNAERFFSRARRVAMKKPIIVIKPGKSNEAKHAAVSHTGALSSNDAAFDAACERAGILRVTTIEDLFSMAAMFSDQPLPKGPRLAILTNAGGPSVLATDTAIVEGASLAHLAEHTIYSLSEFLPAAWSKGNPIDLLGDASPERYKKAAQLVLDDPNVDAVLYILTPQDMTDPKATADELVSISKNRNKTVLASWMGGESVQKGREIFAEAGIPSFSYPDEAAKAFSIMWKYSQSIEALYEIPKNVIGSLEDELSNQKQIHKQLAKFVKENRMLLSESESKHILKQWGIPVLESFKATSKEEAVRIADTLGYPVVLKLESNDVVHKADMGGVKLSLQSSLEVEVAFDSIYESTLKKYSECAFKGVSVQKMVPHSGFEVIVGSSTDPQFGPILLFGAGGNLVEVFQDVALTLPPLNSVLAKGMIRKTKISKKLVNQDAFEQVLVQFSDFISALPEIKECDLNPIIATKTGVLVLDARIVLQKGPFVPSVIKSYPLRYIVRKTGCEGTELLFRSIKSEDELKIIQFHKSLSEKMVLLSYLRMRSLEERTSHARMSRICFADPDRYIIILGEYEKEGDKLIAGAVRLTRLPWSTVWDLMYIVKDEFDTNEIVSMFLTTTLDIADREGISTISASVFEYDEARLALLKQFGFSEYRKHDSVIQLLRLG